MSAVAKLDKAIPGPKWTTDKIVKFAKELLAETGDLTAAMQYRLVMLAVKPGQPTEVAAMVTALWKNHWAQKGEVPPDTVEVD